jgi:hypothetical protein
VAAENVLVLVPNHHGQFNAMYRRVNDPTIALNIGNQGLGNNIVVTPPQRAPRDVIVIKRATGDGRVIAEYWRPE